MCGTPYSRPHEPELDPARSGRDQDFVRLAADWITQITSMLSFTVGAVPPLVNERQRAETQTTRQRKLLDPRNTAARDRNRTPSGSSAALVTTSPRSSMNFARSALETAARRQVELGHLEWAARAPSGCLNARAPDSRW